MRQKNVLEYLERTVKDVPDKIAFVDEHQAVSFRQLYDRSRALGSSLAHMGYKREPVAVMLGDTVDAIIAFLGCLYSNCWYVPLDPRMGMGRVQTILNNFEQIPIIFSENTFKYGNQLTIQGEKLSYEALTVYPIDEAFLLRIRQDQIDTDPMYIVFTSGSTGIPKGVVGCHRAVIDYIEGLSRVLNLREDTVFGNQSPLFFDACFKELFPTIQLGATAYLIPRNLFMFPIQLVNYLNSQKINTICWVSSALSMISSLGTFDRVIPYHLRTIAFGSEVFSVSQLKKWQTALPKAEFFNLYGPTECTGMSCYYQVKEGDTVLPIGKPFPNVRIVVLKENGQIAEDEELGEICISGTCLTLGYYGNMNKSKEVYVQNPTNNQYSELFYRTGDLGWRTKNADLMFGGRKDHQIKRMGHRIELGEIEAVANQIPEVQAACCIAMDKKLVLFCVGGSNVELVLKSELPRYMLPNRVVYLQKMPLTANGKIDRFALMNGGFA